MPAGTWMDREGSKRGDPPFGRRHQRPRCGAALGELQVRRLGQTDVGRDFARLLLEGPGMQRMRLVGPLQPTVRTPHRRPVGERRGIGRRQQRGKLHRALVDAPHRAGFAIRAEQQGSAIGIPQADPEQLGRRRVQLADHLHQGHPGRHCPGRHPLLLRRRGTRRTQGERRRRQHGRTPDRQPTPPQTRHGSSPARNQSQARRRQTSRARRRYRPPARHHANTSLNGRDTWFDSVPHWPFTTPSAC